MKHLTISKKLYSFTAVGLLALITVSVAGMMSVGNVRDDAAALVKAPEAMRGATLADMYHDAVNGIVVGQVARHDADSLEAANTELDAASKNFTESLDRAKATGLSSDISAAVDRAKPEVQTYVARAKVVLDALAAGEDSSAAEVDFEAAFRKLEGSLPDIADAVDAATNNSMTHAEATASRGRTLGIALMLLAVAAMSVISWWLTRSILGPVRRTGSVLDAVADGDLTQRVEIHGSDEIAQMAGSLNVALDNLAGAMVEIGNHSGTLASASEELTAVSSQLAAVAHETSAQAGIVSSAAGQVSENVAVVAAGTGEMTASIQEISHGAQDAVSVADQAAQVAQATNDTVAKLGVSSAEIGNVVKVITSIAEQTNLLALNATIEAARAGEAGKGFAVVAHEVKELASATAAATADISERIGAIQGDAADSVRAIGEITEIIGRVGETQASIASAVEQQTATTNEIGRNVAEAADNSTEIARNISGVARAAEDASLGASNTQDTAAELARMASELQVLVSGFRC